MGEKIGWKDFFKTTLASNDIMIKKDQSISELFREVISGIRREGHIIDYCIVNREAEQKLLSYNLNFIAFPLIKSRGPSYSGQYMGIDVYVDPTKKEGIAFIIKAPTGFYTITRDGIKRNQPPGPKFITKINS